MAKHCYSYDDKTYVCVQRTSNQILFNDQKQYYIALMEKKHNYTLRKIFGSKMFATIEEADEYLDREAAKRHWNEY